MNYFNYWYRWHKINYLYTLLYIVDEIIPGEKVILLMKIPFKDNFSNHMFTILFDLLIIKYAFCKLTHAKDINPNQTISSELWCSTIKTNNNFLAWKFETFLKNYKDFGFSIKDESWCSYVYSVKLTSQAHYWGPGYVLQLFF